MSTINSIPPSPTNDRDNAEKLIENLNKNEALMQNRNSEKLARKNSNTSNSSNSSEDNKTYSSLYRKQQYGYFKNTQEKNWQSSSNEPDNKKFAKKSTDDIDDSTNFSEESDVELRHKPKKSFTKTLRRSFRNSFRLVRSISENGEHKYEKRSKPTHKKVIRVLSEALCASPSALRRQPPAPLLVEDPPSSDEGNDLDDLKFFSDPTFLNGSSGNFGPSSAAIGGAGAPPCSVGGASSAPGTPAIPIPPTDGHALQQHHSSSPGGGGGAQSQPPSPAPIFASEHAHNIQRSPSHSVFTKCDKTSLKHLSTSTPTMTAQAQSVPPEPPSPKGGSGSGGQGGGRPSSAAAAPEVRPTASKARQKKFLRHFPNVEDDEKVLNHYSCALIGDILLQGHLYITKNYFAFYSNVFGYVTKLLIPILTVEAITKEKTARIIPNAVGVATGEDKHVFGSLMSRDSTLLFMRTVWEKAKTANAELVVPEPDLIAEHDQDSSESVDGESGRESPGPEVLSAAFPLVRKLAKDDSKSNQNEGVILERKDSRSFTKTLKEAITEFRKLPRQSLILFATTLLLILLFLSAAVLLYRISRIQDRYSLALHDKMIVSGGEDIYSDLLQWQTHLHSKSADAVHTFLDSNLDQIAKVRQSLEALSTLLVQNANSQTNSSPSGSEEKLNSS